MKKKLFIAILAVTPSLTFSQVLNADFETPLPGADTAWFGQDQVIDGDTTFIVGGLEFENNYNAQWGSFSGWAYSNSIDVTTFGFSNQFSAIPESGAQGSGQFGVCYNFGDSRVFVEDGSASVFNGAYFTNTTYAYLSMLNGDNFAKQFGDSTDANGVVDSTDGEDFFLLEIFALGADSLRTGESVDFYLADYRFADNSQDYIVNDWEFVDLSVLGAVHGLDFVLSSSDEGMFGMNTPAYFAMDNLTGGTVSITENKPKVDFTIFPNPATDMVSVKLNEPSQVTLIDVSGKVLYQVFANSSQISLPINNISAGMYFVSVESNGERTTKKLMKK